MQMLGYLNRSLTDFFLLEPKEIVEIIDLASSKLKNDHYLHYIATANARGMCFGGGDFDYIDVFAKSESISDEYTEDEVEYLRNF